MRFQSVYPNAADVLAASREELAIGMLPVLADWETGYALSIEELIGRVCGDGNNAFPLARYNSHRKEVAQALEKAWRWLERKGLILPNLLGAGGSPSKLSEDAVELARDPHRAALSLRTDSVNLPASRAPAAAALGAKLKSVDMRSVEIEMARALGSVDRDPEDALTAASSILEAVCHSLLEASGRERQPFKDTRSLLNAVHNLLDLRPTDAATADVRRILGGLNSVILGVGALRTHAGDAHGRSSEQAPTPPRHARLSINAACAAALFLIETWESRQST